jgi:hypothetical protein
MALRAGVPSAMTKFGKDLSMPCNCLIINVRAVTWKQVRHVTARIRLEYQRTPLNNLPWLRLARFTERRPLAVSSLASLVFLASASYNDSISEYRQALATDVAAD